MARQLEEKLLDVQTSDLGRFMATKPELVMAFIRIQDDTIFLSDRALEIRIQRLRKAQESLRAYQSATQGPFRDDNSLAKAVKEEVKWLKDMREKLSSRLAIIETAELQFDPERNWSAFPTLQDEKKRLIAETATRLAAEEVRARRTATEEAAIIRRETVFNSILKTENQKTEQLARLEELSRLAMLEEFNVKAAKLDQQRVIAEEAGRMVATETTRIKADAEQDRIKTYLQSAPVKSLLAPFISNGWKQPGMGDGDYLEAGPMSYQRLAGHNSFHVSPLTPTAKGLEALVTIISRPHENDRGGWGTTREKARESPPDFVNMDGKKVNRYVEAQRILREHGQLLVELKMLRP